MSPLALLTGLCRQGHSFTASLLSRRDSSKGGIPFRFPTRSSTLWRWLKFNLVGAMGIAVQLAAVEMFSHAWGLGDQWASALAVEISLLHNFAWHERFTWGDAPLANSHKPVWGRLFRFHLTNGAISLVGNLVVVRRATAVSGLPLMAANLMAIGCCGLLNFLACHRVVFRSSCGAR